LLAVRMPWHRRHCRKLFLAGALLVLLVVALGVWSYWYGGGGVCVDGNVPPWGIEVAVKDEAGRPLEGATLTLHPRRRGGPVSVGTNSQGQAILMRRHGQEYGGTVRRYFFFITVEDFDRPEYDCEVTCPGYLPAGFRLDALQDKADRSIANDLYPGDPLMALRIYQRTVVLKKQ